MYKLSVRKAKKRVKGASFKGETVPTEKPVAESEQRIYTVRDLPIPKQFTFSQYFLYLQAHPEIADRLLQPGEVFALEFYGNRSLSPLSSASLFSTYMERYESLSEQMEDPSYTGRLIENIRILKIGKKGQRISRTEQQYKKETKKMEVERKRTRKLAAKLYPEATGGEKREPTMHELLKAATKEHGALLEENTRLGNMLADVYARLEKLEKRSKKNGKPNKGTKAAPKKATAKPKPAKKVSPKPKTPAKNKTGKVKKGKGRK